MSTRALEPSKVTETPIPNLEFRRTIKKSWGYDNISIASPPSPEPLRDALSSGLCGKNYWLGKHPDAMAEIYLRASVVEMLLEADLILQNGFGLNLYLRDGYRPRSLQMESKKEVLRRNNGSEASAQFTSSARIPPHLTGGAVDLQLRRDGDGPVEIFQSGNETNHTSYPDALEGMENLSDQLREARKNRRILYHTLSSVGFVCNPTEFWHYSWNDQMWARVKGEKCAKYGDGTDYLPH